MISLLLRGKSAALALVLCSFSSLVTAEVVGLSNGTFRVNESGAATYSVKIEAAPGRAGVAPDITLNYSSNNVIEGSMGVGWSLGGVQMITRCPQTPIHDSNIRAVNYSSEDRFCLDGRRLILISGAYGAPNSTYRLEVDDLSTIRAIGGSTANGPQYFEIKNKAGETHYFGNTSILTPAFNNPLDSRDAFVEPAGFTAGVLAKAWAIKAIEDVKGNFISFHYDKDRQRGTHFLSSVNYSGHRPSGRAAFAEIRFVYKDYGKGFVGYQAGTKAFRDRLLTRVESKIDDQFYRVFHLSYESSDFIEERTLLTSIQECPDNTASRAMCLRPTEFNWERPPLATSTTVLQEFTEEGYTYSFRRPSVTNYNPFPSGSSTITGTDNRHTAQVFDMTGDGFHDLVYVRAGKWRIRKGPQFSPEEELTSVGAGSPENALNIDYDGNGTRDLLVASSATASWQVIAYASGYGDPQQVPPGNCDPREPCSPIPIYTNANIKSLYRTATGWSQKAQVLDVDGDGLEDIVFQDGTALKSYLNEGSGNFSQAVTLFNGQGSMLLGSEKRTASMKSASAFDVNADGRSDLFIEVTTILDICYSAHGDIIRFITSAAECLDAGGTWVPGEESTVRKLFVSDGSPSAPTFTEQFVLTADVETVRVADFNGDGLQDVAYVRNDAWYYRISDGTTLLEERPMSNLTGNLTTADNRRDFNQFVDLNGDGRADVLHATSTSNWDIYFSRPTNEGDWVIFEKRGSWSFPNQAVIRFGDVNGDGKLELLTSTGSSWAVRYNRPGIKEYVVKTITNGNGVKTDISYSPMTDSDVYVFPYSESLEHPETMSPVYGMFVVDRVQTDSNEEFGLVKRMAVSYEYGGMLIHRKGRGSLGFQMLRTTDEQSGVISETRYAQEFTDAEYPKTGMPVYSEKRLGGQLLSRSTNTLAVKTTGQGGRMPYVSTSSEEAYILDSFGVGERVSTTSTTDDYDSWGNLINRQVQIVDAQTGEQWTTSTINNFGNTNEQKLGRLKWTSVSKNRTGYTGTISRRTDFTYNADNMLASSTVSPSVAATRVVTSYVYDEFGNTIEKSQTGYSTSTGETQTRTSYTSFGSRGRYVAYRENALGEQVSYLYNGVTADQTAGIIESMTETDPNGLSTTSSYDNLGRIVSTLHPDERLTTVAREECSNCVVAGAHYYEYTQEDGQPDVQVYYDRWGREVVKRTQGFTGGWYAVVTKYDDEGRKQEVFEPNTTAYSTAYEYDELDRIITMISPKNGLTRYTYSPLSVTVTNPKGQVTQTFKNGFGEVVYTKDHLGNEVHFVRDAYGNTRQTQTKADGKTSTVTATY